MFGFLARFLDDDLLGSGDSTDDGQQQGEHARQDVVAPGEGDELGCGVHHKEQQG